MKIATQLIGNTPNTATKAGASLDNGTEFHGIFTAAAAKGTGDKSALPLREKSPTQDAKSPIVEIKKKSTAPDPGVAGAAQQGTSVPKQILSDTVTQYTTPVTPDKDVIAESSEPKSTDSHPGADSVGAAGSFSSSLSSISSFIQLPASVSTKVGTDQQFANVEPKEIAHSAPLVTLAVTDKGERLGSNPAPSHSELQSTGAAPEHLLQSQGQILSTTATTTPTTPASLLAVSAPPVTLQAVSSPGPVADSSSIPSAPAAVGSVISPEPVAVDDTISELPIADAIVVPNATLAVEKNVPATSISLPPAAFSAPLSASKTAPVSPVATPRSEAEKNVSAQPVIGQLDVTPAPVATAKVVPASSGSVPAVSQTSPTVAAPITSAPPASHSSAPETAVIDLSAVAKTTDTSNLSPTPTPTDSTNLATQQGAGVAAQSVAASVLVPSFGVIGVSQATPAVAADQSQIAGRVSDNGKGTVSREATSVMKSKPGPATSTPGNRFADTDGNSTQTESVPTVAMSSVTKGTEAPVSPNQGASDSRSFDIASLQQTPQSGPIDGGSHTPPSAQSLSAPAEAAAQTVPAQAVPDSQAMQGVSSAQLIQSMRSSEMKLGMQSAEFGNISISTSLNHQALSAQISIDHTELGRTLAAHLPAIEEKLGSAYGVQARVELRDSSNPSSSSDTGYSNSGQQSREQRQSQGGGSTASQGATFERIAARASFTPVSTTATVSRLDIRI